MKVVESFWQSASAEAIADLEGGRPSIARDVDRVLLLDLSDTLEVYDLRDTVRVRLRARFWDKYDELS